MGDNKQMEEVCKQLDQLVLDFFETMDSLYLEQANLAQLMKDGYFQMSKARYSMGNKAVSSLQYDTNKMEALVKVDVAGPSFGDGDSDYIFSLVKCDKEQTVAPSVDEDVKPSGLRHRNVNPQNVKDEDCVKKDNDNEHSGDQEKSVSHPKKAPQSETLTDNHDKENGKDNLETSKDKKTQSIDPIKWFGVLVPQSLKQSQSDFKRAIETACKIAELRANLESIRKKYASAMKYKGELQAEQ